MPKNGDEYALSVINDNLIEAKDAFDSSVIMKNAHICELAHALKDQFFDPEYVRNEIENAGLFGDELAVFALEFAKYVSPDHEFLPFSPFTAVSDDPLTAYFRNPISDVGFTVFSKELKKIKYVYFDSFSACAEDVSTGASDCCMLPIYDFSDGEMWSVRRLIDKHGLSIVMTVELPTSRAATNFVRFALLSGEPLMAKNANTLRVTAFFEDRARLTEFLDGCRYMGAELKSLVCVPVAFYDTPAFDIDFVMPKESFHPLAVYLALFYPRINVGGIYRQIDAL